MRTILLRFCYRLLAALMLCATASVAVPFPTNMDLLVETVASAVDESLARIEMPDDAATAPLLVVAQSRHDANWMVEHLLANRLLTRGFSVTLDSTAVQPASMRLSYRVLDLGISAHSGLRGSKVSRQGRVTLALRLSDERDDVVHWQDEITRTQRDWIPKKQLDSASARPVRIRQDRIRGTNVEQICRTCDRIHRARWAYLFVLL